MRTARCILVPFGFFKSFILIVPKCEQRVSNVAALGWESIHVIQYPPQGGPPHSCLALSLPRWPPFAHPGWPPLIPPRGVHRTGVLRYPSPVPVSLCRSFIHIEKYICTHIDPFISYT
ncbi:hypothetical protein GDO81_024981 [Engystomops pustulosus]|uniref:Secreted protein n=1 Tax=Engystomops pustulosus TaxID=76066 RepID=A0AAV6YPJ8_ENGPU|nr:hypothetical protein GDO81_024981 [Engystomops pustulosus]